MTALWFYDYLLTLDDEVMGFQDDDDTEMNLITPYRFVIHGARRALQVGEPSHFSCGGSIDRIPVFMIFLLASTLCVRHYLALTAIQTRYIPVPFLVWTTIGEWNSISLYYPTHANTAGH